MQKTIRLHDSSRLFARIMSIGALAASLLVLPATTAPATPADKRKPGLYWTFETDKGKISCRLFEAEAPVTVRTMVGLAIGKMSYVNPETKETEHQKFFDGLTFHRVIPPVMIQGGDLLGTGAGALGGPGFPFKTEVSGGLKFDTPGRLAMANRGADQNDSQFFITESAYSAFNGKYTIWGQCENADVVKAIAETPRDANNRPVTTVHIQHVVIERVGPAPADAPESMPEDSPAK
jgi:peptidyl-prolyl cis-trans isomerase A (cyclophilin A)